MSFLVFLKIINHLIVILLDNLFDNRDSIWDLILLYDDVMKVADTGMALLHSKRKNLVATDKIHYK
ncbi:hypothetical protein [Wolbachia endosymbiont (group A) of Tiphia femorata]|uniref:hypothetical protein n=1 Tax=Wolbachia endosymbiont (group A) of Tiphia femorata TaxID=2954063 RepID=UPI00223075B2|nr:hypothetical protein [Wolbachia endosymbiont (group A) of Tiphia femorata]